MRTDRFDINGRRRNSRRLITQWLEDRIPLSVSPLLVTGAGPGGGPHVRAFEGPGTAEVAGYFAYSPAFGGGVRVAVGDVNGDGHLDTITGAGPGGGPHVRVFDGRDQSELFGFFAYDRAFTGGVFVALGDINADGRADIITGQGQGGLPHVRVFNGVNGELMQEWFAYNVNFRGGVQVAAGDFNHDGLADIVTGAGPGGGPHVRVFDGRTVAELAGFFAYAPDFTGGVYVATGNFDGDSRADVATMPFSQGRPQLRIFAGSDLRELASVLLKSPQREGSQQGLPIAAADFDNDGLDEIVIGSGAGERPLVSIHKPAASPPMAEFLAYNLNFRGGVFVAAENVTPAGDLAPVVTARLAADTGISSTDSITTDPTISGTVSDTGPVTSLVASIDDTPLQEVAPGTVDYRGTFTITQAMMEAWLGGPLADGQHFVALQATDATGKTSPLIVVNFRLDRTPPTVVSPLADIAVFEDSPDLALDMTGRFSGDGLTFSVSGNTNPNVVQARVQGNFVLLDFLENRFGEGNQAPQITVRATEPNGMSVEDRFVVDVVPQNDNPTTVAPLRQITIPRTAAASERVIALGGAFADADDLGTLVQFQTSLGNINVELFNAGTPITVQNFLRYANDTTAQGGDYNDSIIHRSARSRSVWGIPS